MASSLRGRRHINKSSYIDGDPLFYEHSYKYYSPTDELKTIVDQILAAQPTAWRMDRTDVWTHVIPPAYLANPDLLPTQGWKIHVSATNVNCWDILAKTARILVGNQTQFKFANDTQTLRLLTSKRWSRGGSGKFITAYPQTEAHFVALLDEIDAATSGYSASYILSDRRYRNSRCLYYRYGTIISHRVMDFTGLKTEMLTGPDGTLVPDRREPFFTTPSWVADMFPPDEDTSDEDDDAEPTLKDGRYTIGKALSFSNTGGVYLARDNHTGREVIIKEARPGVELGISGEDAIARLSREAGTLTALNDAEVTPRMYDTFWDWENFYLVEEYLHGEDMRLVMLKNTPLLKVHPTTQDSEAFYALYLRIITGLIDAIEAIHSRGIVIGDLSPTNILYDPGTGRVRIIDLESAYRPGIDGAQDIHTPGFRNRAEGRAEQNTLPDDSYAAGTIMMYSIFPLAALSYLRDDVYTAVAPVIVRDAGWSDTPVLAVLQGLVEGTTSLPEARAALAGDARIGQPLADTRPPLSARDIEDVRRGLARFIGGTFRQSPDRTLSPIDPFGQATNPLGLGFGATGVVDTLLRSGAPIPDQALARFDAELADVRPDQFPPGLINGFAGMAWGLFARDRIDTGTRFLEFANASPLARRHHSLYYGMAGLGMANLKAFRVTGDRRHLLQAIELAEELVATAERTAEGLRWPDEGTVHLGYGYGQSGVALFLLRLSQASGDARWRTAGEAALGYDLRFCVAIEPGVMSFGESAAETETLEQYIEQGSGGVAKVALRYGLLDRIEGLIEDQNRKYSTFPGLIYGLSGFVDVLTDAYLYSRDEKYLAYANRPIRGLVDLYLFETERGLATPGENLFRISCDYATGTAGVLSALDRYAGLKPDEFCLDDFDSPAGA